ncbi:MAG: serpin family protein [Polyangiaceae bacterium]|nr:serpin family protein [Polyangiaceae bacterium]
MLGRLRGLCGALLACAVVAGVTLGGCSVAVPRWKEGPLAPPSAKEAAPGANAFAMSLFGKVRRAGENLVLSPLSMRVVLLMAHAGARGETAAEMAKALGISEAEDVHTVAIATLRALAADNGKGGLALALANRLWGHVPTTFHEPFLELLREGYGAPLERVDLRAPEVAASRINDWVAEETKGLIQDLLSPADIGRDTKLVLTNAVYFKGTWLEPFEEELTSPSPFYRLDGSTRYVHMMGQTVAQGRYGQDEGVDLVELGYFGGSTAMVLAVPRERAGLPALEAGLTGAVFERWLAALARQKVDVRMPRFRLSSRLEMGQALRDLGMERAFGSVADFSGMSPEPIWLEAALQASFVEVNEVGTEAAAASALSAGGFGPGVPEPPVPVVVADRPFLFFIRHRATGVVLFMGRVTDPCSGNKAACPDGPRPPAEPQPTPDLDE